MSAGSAMQPRKGAAWMLLGLCGLLALSAISMMVGKYGTGPVTLLTAVKAALTGGTTDPILATVLWNVRLPRVLAGLCVGAALAAAGTTYQGLFRNPLVSPDILGVSAGASLGAVLGIFLSLPVIAIQMLGFLGGLLAVAAVYAVGAAIRGRDPVLTLVLAGVAIGALVGAGISLIKTSPTPMTSFPPSPIGCLGA